MTRPLTVLFAEHGAPTRAPMAAGFLGQLTRGEVVVRYAATEDRPLHPLVEPLLRELDAAPGRPRCEGEGPFDIVVVLAAPDACPPLDVGAPEPSLPPGLVGPIAPSGDPGLVPFRIQWRVSDPLAAASVVPGGPDALQAAFREARDAVRCHVEALVRHGYLAAMRSHLGSTWEYVDHPPSAGVAVPRDEPPSGEVGNFHGMVGRSRVMRDVFRTIRQVGVSDYSVLITGESGTGKELVASAIHAESRRSCGPFVPINCGALPETILESELFGHVRGAFTGAIRDKKGRFELAHGGTLFLDEIGELTPSFQVKLLRVLQERSFERVGGERLVSVDVRIVSATNRDLRRLVRDGSFHEGTVREGTFREDLFYRLCVVPIVLPPLRERPEDILPIAEHALGRIREEAGRPALRLGDAAREALLLAPWPGNVRQLINALQFASVHCAGDVVEPLHLPPEVRAPAASRSGSADPASRGRPLPRAAVRDARGRPRKLDGPAVERALDAADGNKARAARILGVGRATLYRFLNDSNRP